MKNIDKSFVLQREYPNDKKKTRLTCCKVTPTCGKACAITTPASLKAFILSVAFPLPLLDTIAPA